MQPADWIVIGAYFIATIYFGLKYSRRAGESTGEFFLSGRNLPWWLAGTSMVATTFAADTPLAVTELVARNGIAGNWLWWNFVLGGMLTVFFFARLWRRAGVLTDVEFVELRYSGRSAAFLRAFRSVYLGLFMNSVIIGWVNLAMAAILQGMFGLEGRQAMIYVAAAMLLTALYSAVAGLWGVAVTDVFQFIFAMVGCIVLTFFVLAEPAVGGLGGLVEKLPEWSLRFLPAIGGPADGLAAGSTLALSGLAFLAYVGIQWWASWYPGAEPGGGGYVAQRMMSAKDEKHSLLATLWFTVAHYCIRPWPWILVGLASLLLYPELGPDEKRLGYVYAMRDYLPVGLRGMLVAAFFAAYMSTIATQLNWGTSYLVNDFYRRFLARSKEERHYVTVSRVMTILVMAASFGVTLMMDTISGAWAFIIEAGAGLGLVLIVRWFWWRVNAWSEISAMVTPILTFAYVKSSTTLEFPVSLFLIVSVTTVVWVAVTLTTKPAAMETLRTFYARVHPGGWWDPVRASLPGVRPDGGYGRLVVDWLAGVVMVYAVLFGVGKLLLGSAWEGILYLAVGAAAASLISIHITRYGWEKEGAPPSRP
ncbi:MAG TPA: sodium:solute symporter family protein [Bacteroidota bacterium]|nr:sodium:solute symporter family protein [Bacteroidota bacterium]